MLATDVWQYLIADLIKHKSGSLIRKALVWLSSFALVLFFIGVIQYIITLGLSINSGATKTTNTILVLCSLLVFPVTLGIALVVAYIMIGLMMAADIEHETVTKKGARPKFL
jgi:predicted membrane protein